MELNLLLLLLTETLKSQGILNWETQSAPKKGRGSWKGKNGNKNFKNLPYAGGAKGKYHMIEHNMGYKIVTSLGNVKRTIGKIRKAMKIKQLLVDPPSSHST